MEAREWAHLVINKLQAEGHQSLLAGGCVRDSLLKVEPKDFDVATSATPDEVQDLFGRKKTISIGKSFGVITVIGPKSAGNIEVATFRRDGGYSDGRRPDSVEFTDAREDALRRDFTINGMFYDPLADEVIDYVGGQSDIKSRVIRAIGDPDKRIEEDRLRMLRAVRFAARYYFEIESSTMAAIEQRASDITDVSPERIGMELRKMFSHENKAIAWELLRESGLWQQVLPSEFAEENWEGRTSILKVLDADFPTTLVAILQSSGLSPARLQDCWKLTNEEVTRAEWIAKNASQLATAKTLRWSVLQPLLISPHAARAVALNQSILDSGSLSEIDSVRWRKSISLCREKLALSRELLDPQPLVKGEDLKELRIAPGPRYKQILSEVRRMQLDGELATAEEARNWIVKSGAGN